MLLLGIATLLILAQTTLGAGNPHATPSASSGVSPQAPTALPTSSPSAPAFHEYAFPRSDSQVMRLAMDHQGRLWFGAMGQNTLMWFDPSTHLFQHITPPQGRSGIMGIQVAADDTIWFAEQFANYIGHYFPATHTFHQYPLPILSVPDPSAPGKTLSEPSGPNDLVLDAQGNVWFTEFNAGLVGRFDPQTGRFRHYTPTSSPGNAQELAPYGLTIDAQGTVWFTEMGGHTVGRLDPRTGGVSLYSLPAPGVSPMEIASDHEGNLWITTFDAGLLLALDPHTGHVTRYQTSLASTDAGGLYGLVIAPNDDVWVTILAQNALARLDSKTRTFVYYRVPTANSSPLALIAGPHQTFWFSEIQQLGELTFSGA
jgi:streptogramin lyase